MGRGAGNMLYGDRSPARSQVPAPKPRKVVTDLVQSAATDHFAEGPTPNEIRSLAGTAAWLGRLCGAQNVRMHAAKNVSLYANANGVSFAQSPEDLPFREHPAWDAPALRELTPLIPIAEASDYTGNQISSATANTDPLALAAAAMRRVRRQVHLIDVRLDTEDGSWITVNNTDASLYRTVPRRFVGTRTETVRTLPVD